MVDALTTILITCWEIFKEASPFVLFGFFAAGVLKALIPEALVARHLGRNGTASVLKAALFGIPLPLCSCGVIPVAVGLRKQGASKGATAAFLISVPETGVDSISITWALLDPLMTLIRPLAAFTTAVATGLVINLLPATRDDSGGVPCGCAKEGGVTGEGDLQVSLWRRLEEGLRYAFSTLLRDIGKWLMLGILIAGIITFFLPEDFAELYLGGEYSSLLIMLVVGIPLYICASASTPIAAALVLKGLSPGAALVFLLAGPATNAATMTVIAKHLGKAATLVYVVIIAAASLAFGWGANRLYLWLGIDITAWVDPGRDTTESILYLLSAITLLTLLLWNHLPCRGGIKSRGGCREESGGG